MAERRRRLGVGAEHALRIGPARGGIEGDAVDDVAAIDGQGDAALHLERRRARLGELAGHPPDPDRPAGPTPPPSRAAMRSISAEIALDVRRREFGEAFGAVAALEQEGAARLRLGERGLERVDLADARPAADRRASSRSAAASAAGSG